MSVVFWMVHQGYWWPKPLSWSALPIQSMSAASCDIAPHVFQRAVAVAMGGVLGVAVELAAGQLIGLAAPTRRGTRAAAGCLATRGDAPA